MGVRFWYDKRVEGTIWRVLECLLVVLGSGVRKELRSDGKVLFGMCLKMGF